MAWKAETPSAQPEIVTTDFDLDGQEEILIRQSISGMTLHPADGATVSSLRFQPSNVELVNSLMRRPEALPRPRAEAGFFQAGAARRPRFHPRSGAQQRIAPGCLAAL